MPSPFQVCVAAKKDGVDTPACQHGSEPLAEQLLLPVSWRAAVEVAVACRDQRRARWGVVLQGLKHFLAQFRWNTEGE
eukprot:7823391-Lingulodinium_polyedra.AAC.1